MIAKMGATKTDVLILLSGGIDSAACLNYYISSDYKVNTLFVDFQQANEDKESDAAMAITSFYNVNLDKITIEGLSPPVDYMPARNAMLLALALSKYGVNQGIIAMGIHAGTRYADCSSDFQVLMQNLFDLYEHGQVFFGAPFINWTKHEILLYSQQEGVPLHLTYSSNPQDLLTSDFYHGENQ